MHSTTYVGCWLLPIACWLASGKLEPSTQYPSIAYSARAAARRPSTNDRSNAQNTKNHVVICIVLCAVCYVRIVTLAASLHLLLLHLQHSLPNSTRSSINFQ